MLGLKMTSSFFAALAGAGRIFDLWGGSDYLTPRRSAEETDRRAIYEDWSAFRRDMGHRDAS